MRHDVPATASDVWSVGCTAIELLTGEPPYFELAPITALYKIVQENQPPFPTGISAELNDFLRKCFTREPEHRATAAQLRQHDWLRPELHAPAAAVDPSATPLAATPPDDARIRDGELHATSRESWGVATRESGHSNSGGGRGGSGGGAAPGRRTHVWCAIRPRPEPAEPARLGRRRRRAARSARLERPRRRRPRERRRLGTNSFGEPVLLHKGIERRDVVAPRPAGCARRPRRRHRPRRLRPSIAGVAQGRAAAAAGALEERRRGHVDGADGAVVVDRRGGGRRAVGVAAALGLAGERGAERLSVEAQLGAALVRVPPALLLPEGPVAVLPVGRDGGGAGRAPERRPARVDAGEADPVGVGAQRPRPLEGQVRVRARLDDALAEAEGAERARCGCG